MVKRTWNPDLKDRLDRLVTTLPNNGYKGSNNETVGGADIHAFLP